MSKYYSYKRIHITHFGGVDDIMTKWGSDGWNIIHIVEKSDGVVVWLKKTHKFTTPTET